MQLIDLLKSAILIAASSVAAAAVINHIVSRTRNRRVDNVSRLVTVCGVRRRDVVGVLQKLEVAGFGRFVIGRRGHDSRFIWGEL